MHFNEYSKLYGAQYDCFWRILNSFEPVYAEKD